MNARAYGNIHASVYRSKRLGRRASIGLELSTVKALCEGDADAMRVLIDALADQLYAEACDHVERAREGLADLRAASEPNAPAECEHPTSALRVDRGATLCLACERYIDGTTTTKGDAA